MNLGVFSIGDIRFKLIEPISESIYSEYCKEYSKGIMYHLKFGVENYFDVIEDFTSIGITVIQLGHQLDNEGKNMYTYLDTRESLGFIIELVNVTPDFIKPNPDHWFPKNKKLVSKSIFKRPN